MDELEVFRAELLDEEVLARERQYPLHPAVSPPRGWVLHYLATRHSLSREL